MSSSVSPDNTEISRLLDLMPASGRMYTRLVSRSQQKAVISTDFPLPWQDSHPIAINFGLWYQLPQSQRDLLLLHTVCWIISVRGLKFDLYTGLMIVGLTGVGFELLWADAAGILTSSAIAIFAGTQMWRKKRSTEAKVLADEAAIQVAQRRGYSEKESAKHLLEGIAAVAQLEGRALEVAEIVRRQNLRALAGLSPVDALDPLLS